MTEEPASAEYDPNYRWRVLGAVSIISVTALSVTMTAIFSEALSAGYIAGLFGMEFGLALTVILVVLVRPPEKKGGFSMDNPWVGVPLGIVVGVVTSFFLKWLGTT